MKNKIYSVFDVCGTLFFSNTTFDFIIFYHKFTGNYNRYLKSYFLSSIFGKILERLGVLNIRKELILSLRGQSKNNLEQVANAFYSDFLSSRVNSKAMDILRDEKKSSNVVLASASIEPVIKVIANRLGVDYFSSRLEVESDLCTGELEYDNLGNKDQIFKFKYVKLVVTDNLCDVNLCKLSRSAVIFSRKKNVNYWKEVLDVDNDLVSLYEV